MLSNRWTALVAVVLGVTVIATMALVLAAASLGPHRGPERFAAVPAVVRADPYLHAGQYSVPLPGRPALSAAQLAAYPGATADRSFDVRIGGRALVGHPWSSAAFAAYRLTAGQAPAAPDQIVLGGGAPSLVGRALTLDTGRYVVTGVTASVPFERAVFFTDAKAARLSPRVDAVVPRGPVRAVPGVQVLTGAARHRADPDYRVTSDELTGLTAFLGVAALLAGSVTLYVLATTFGLSVVQRRRELALLRLVGATPAQVVRQVCAAALPLGLYGSAAGCLLGLATGPALAAWMAARGLAPSWFRIEAADALVALPPAFVGGVAVSVLAVLPAAVRAARVRPAEALRAAAADERPPARIRGLLGGLGVLAGLGTLAATWAMPLLAADLKTDVIAILLVVAGTALLVPWLLPALVLALPARSWAGQLARQNTRAAPHRGAAVVVPVLFTVGLAAAILGCTATEDQATAAQSRAQAPPGGYVVLPDHTPGLTPAQVARVERLADATAVTDTTVLAHQPEITPLHLEAPMPIPFPALAVAHPDPALLRLPVRAGSLRGLGRGTVAVDTTWRLPVGGTLHLWLADGTPETLRVVAVLRAGLGPGLVLGEGDGDPVSRVLVAPGADPAALAAPGTSVLPVSRWTAATTDQQQEQTTAGLVVLLAIATCYSATGIVGSVRMSISGRRREWRLLRLAGATRRQLVRVTVTEVLQLGAVGLALSALTAAVPLAGLGHAFAALSGTTVFALPWLPVLALAAGGPLVAVTAAVLATVHLPG